MRTNLILLVLAALLAPATWLTWQRNAARFTDYSDIPHLFDGFVEENVARVVITEPLPRPPVDPATAGPEPAPQTRDLVIDRADDGWKIANTDLAGIEARSADVRRAVLQHLGAIRKDDRALVLSDATDEQLREFALDEGQARRLRVLDGSGTVIADLLLGRSSDGGEEREDRARGYFVRRFEERDVVFYETDSWILSADPNRFAERRVLAFDLSDVVRLELKNRTGILALARPKGAGSWQVGEDGEGRPVAPKDVGAVRQPLVTELINQLARLQVARFLEPLPKDRLEDFGLSTQKCRVLVRVTLADGESLVLWIGEKLPTTNEHYAATDRSPLLLTVGDWIVDAFERDVRGLFDPGEGASSGGVSDRPRPGGGNDGDAPGEGRDKAGSGDQGQAPAGGNGGKDQKAGDPESGDPTPTDPPPSDPAPKDPPTGGGDGGR
jgi:hypothetical protein